MSTRASFRVVNTAATLANMDRRPAFGSRLKLLRERAALTQVELSRRAGVDRSFISLMETGRNLPSLDVVEKLARGLGITVGALIGESEPAPRSEDTALRLLQEAVEGVRGIPVPLVGVVPADSVRWVATEEGEQFVRVSEEMLQGARDPFARRVSGDCLRNLGIVDGDVVIFSRPGASLPRDGDIVLVEVDDEMTLKVWGVEQGVAILRDGEGAVVARLPLHQARGAVLGIAIQLIRRLH